MEVLIVEDDTDFGETLAEILKLHGYKVTITYNGEDAVLKNAEKDYDLTLMDVKLPGIDGVKSFLKIKQSKPEVKIILMTGYKVEELLKKADENGALRILRKPFDVRKVLNLLENMKQNG